MLKTEYIGHYRVYPNNEYLLGEILVKLDIIIKLLTADKESKTHLHETTTDSPDSFTYDTEDFKSDGKIDV